MAETKYGKYIVTQPKPMITPTEWSHNRKGVDRVARVAYLDDEVLKGAFYVETNGLWHASDTGTEAHAQDLDEIIGFFKS